MPVDRERIGGLGICGSGSYLISAAKIDSRIRAIATTSMYDMGADGRSGIQGSQNLDQRREQIETASAQRWAEAAGEDIVYGGGTPLELTDEVNEIGRELFDYYRTSRAMFTPPGSTPNITTHRTIASNVKMMNFYPFNDIETISPRPLLFVSGDQAHSKSFSEDAFSRAAEPKEIFWVEGAGHVDLYNRVELIPFAKFTQFFQENL